MNHLPKKKIVLLIGDAVLIVLAFYFAPAIRFGTLLNVETIWGHADVASVLIYLAAFYIFDAYDTDRSYGSSIAAIRFIIPIVSADLLIASLFYISHTFVYGVGIFFLNSLLIYCFCLGWRIAFERALNRMKKPVSLAILGAGVTGREFHKMFQTNNGYQMVGFLDDDRTKWGTSIDGTTVLGGCDKLESLVADRKVDKVIVAVTSDIRPDVYKRLIEVKFSGVNVYQMPTFCEMVTGKIPVNYLNDMWLINVTVSGIRRTPYNKRVKKILDILISSILLVAAFPLMIVIWIIVRLESEGPALFIQQRVGCHGQVFNIIKFRSMRVDAEQRSAVWAKKNDHRATKVGRIIRLLRFDELPQLWNVLRGDMSFIGPRPERPEFVEQLSSSIPYYSLRHAVKPGLTGWAQVNYPYGASLEDALEKLKYDLYYIKNMSFLLDVHIMLRTVRVVLFGRGAR